MEDSFEIFLVCAPGLEASLAAEAKEQGFGPLRVAAGGLAFDGGWNDVWRANLHLRGAGRVLARIGGFPAVHLAQLDKRARKFDWAAHLRPDVPVKVEAVSLKSKVYHEGAICERIERAITEELGAPIGEGGVRLLVRIEQNLLTFSLDTSGEPLHKRGFKQAIGKAPLRETMAAMFLRQCGYRGTETVLDPMCGSGTFVIEAAEIAAGLAPGRGRSFAFEQFASFRPEIWAQMASEQGRAVPDLCFMGADRDPNVIASARANAERAGVGELTRFEADSVAELARPLGPPGLIMVNPPYGGRIGKVSPLIGLYTAFGALLQVRFRGWRVGMVTSEAGLARASKLPFLANGPPVEHGGMKVRLYRTDPLP